MAHQLVGGAQGAQEGRIARRAALQRRNREDHHPGKDEVISSINVPLKLERRLFE